MLLDISESTAANEGSVGFAVNGVDIYSPYDVDTCCDFSYHKYDYVDYCMGYATGTFPSYGRYHYHYYPEAQGDAGYNNCLASCSWEPSGIVGVAKVI